MLYARYRKRINDLVDDLGRLWLRRDSEDTSEEVSSVFTKLDTTLNEFEVFLTGRALLDQFIWRVLCGKATDPTFEVPLELKNISLGRQTRTLLADFVKVSLTNEMQVKKIKPLENENLSLIERVAKLEYEVAELKGDEVAVILGELASTFVEKVMVAIGGPVWGDGETKVVKDSRTGRTREKFFPDRTFSDLVWAYECAVEDKSGSRFLLDGDEQHLKITERKRTEQTRLETFLSSKFPGDSPLPLLRRLEKVVNRKKRVRNEISHPLLTKAIVQKPVESDNDKLLLQQMTSAIGLT